MINLRLFYRDHIKHPYQRLTRGWDDKALWALDYDFVESTYEKLARFTKTHKTYPASMTSHQWDDILATMLIGFKEWVETTKIENEEYSEFAWDPWARYSDDHEFRKNFDRSMEMFKEYLPLLWS